MACRKRHHGDGCVVQLEKGKPRSQCRKWQLRVSAGKDEQTGRYIRKTRVMEGTYQQACSALDDFRNECGRLASAAPGDDGLQGIAFACAQIKGSMQILSELAEDKDDNRYWALVGSLDSALGIIEPLKERA